MIAHRLLLAALTVSASFLVSGCGGATTGSGSPQTSLAPSSTQMTQTGTSIPFDVFSSPLSQSAITSKRLATVRTDEEWRALWTEHVGGAINQRPVPQVDFSRNMVIGVFLGSRSACDSLFIDAVRKKDDPSRIEVTYRESIPPAGTPCIAMLVNPAVLITVPQSSLPVEFVQAPTRGADELVVRSGWWFGLCVTNCEAAVEIARDGAVFRAISLNNPALQERTIWGGISEHEWAELANSFHTLPDVIAGCPGCADEGREWIEIERAGQKKRLDFSCNAAISGAESLQATVRAIRSRLAVAAGFPPLCSPGSVAFERIEPTVFTSAIADQRFVTIKDANAWSALWNEHTRGNAQPPQIDFSKKMVVGVFAGHQSDPCGRTSIDSVTQRANPDRIEVGYRIVSPGPNVICIAAVVNQYALVTVPVSPLPVEFVRLQ